TVTLEFTVSEPIGEPSVRINGIEATLTGYGTSWQATYTVPEQRVKVSTLAGGTSGGFNDAQGAAALFNKPSGIALDRNGNLYVADILNHRIRKIDASGNVTTLAGSGTSGFKDGSGDVARFNQPSGVAVDTSGNVFVADAWNHRVRKIDPLGNVTTFAGSGSRDSVDGYRTSAAFDVPYDVALDSSGNLYVADRFNYQIRKITPDGTVSTLAGSGSSGSADGAADVATFDAPAGIVVDASGNVYVSGGRKVDPAGNVTTFTSIYPEGLAVDSSGNLYLSEYGNKVYKIDSSGKMTTLAGTGSTGSHDDWGGSATFNRPIALEVDPAGNLYVADYNNHLIRKINIVGEAVNFQIEISDAAGNT
ncbi:MAG: NHL repeat-containing protein, partial [Pseudomonadales bacterium]|nr:NHL repeat-containing protein [Pseudomonadales bacterium]